MSTKPKLVDISRRRELIPAVICFLEEIDSDFSPPFSERVVLSTYAEKIIDLASVAVALDQEDRIIGLGAVYCNDTVTRIGYVTIIGVSRNWRGKGVGLQITQRMIDFCVSSRMATVRLAVSSLNIIAKSVYSRAGFCEIEKPPPHDQEIPGRSLMEKSLG